MQRVRIRAMPFRMCIPQQRHHAAAEQGMTVQHDNGRYEFVMFHGPVYFFVSAHPFRWANSR